LIVIRSLTITIPMEEIMSKSLVFPALSIGTLALAAALLSASGSPSQAATPFVQCHGSRTETFNCCERAIKPSWWGNQHAGCAAAVRCMRVRVSSAGGGKVICRLVRRDDYSHDRGNHDGGRGDKDSSRSPNDSPNSSNHSMN
jgi:hypothetical protein